MTRDAEQVAPSDSNSKTTTENIAAKMAQLAALHQDGHAPSSPNVVVLRVGQALRQQRLDAEDLVKAMPDETKLEEKIQALKRELADFEQGIVTRKASIHYAPCVSDSEETAYDAHRTGLQEEIGSLRKQIAEIGAFKQQTRDLDWGAIALEVIHGELNAALENQLHAMLRNGTWKVPLVKRVVKDAAGNPVKDSKGRAKTRPEPVLGILAIASLVHPPRVSLHPKGSLEPFWLAAKFAKLAKVDKHCLRTLGLRIPDLPMVDPALEKARTARVLFPNIDRLLQPGGMAQETWNISSTPPRLSGFARSAQAALHVRLQRLDMHLQMVPSKDQIRDLGLRDSTVRAAIRWERLQILRMEEGEKARSDSFTATSREQREADQEAQGDIHGRGKTLSAPAERYHVYTLRPGHQAGLDVATGRLEREDEERGDHAGRISRSAFGRRLLAIHDLDPTQQVIPLQVRLGREHEPDTVTATVRKNLVELPLEVRKIIAYGPTDWGGQEGPADPKNGPLPAALEPMFESINPHARQLVVQIWGPMWSTETRATRISVKNPATHGGLAHLRMMVTGRPPKDKDWIEADIDGNPVDLAEYLSPELLGEILDKQDETREGLAAALTRICRRHAKGKRAVLIEFRGEARVVNDHGSRWKETSRKLALFDPVPIRRTALDSDGNEVQKQLPRIIPFQGSGVSIQGTIDAAKAFWAGQDNRIWPVYTEFQEFHIEPVETLYDAVQNVFRYMYPNMWKAVLRGIDAKDIMDQLTDIVPPADWHTFEHNVRQLWDLVLNEPMKQPLPTDLRRLDRNRPFPEDCMVQLENPTASVVAL